MRNGKPTLEEKTMHLPGVACHMLFVYPISGWHLGATMNEIKHTRCNIHGPNGQADSHLGHLPETAAPL